MVTKAVHPVAQAVLRVPRSLGFLPPDRAPWPDEPFAVPEIPLPPHPGKPWGSIQRAVEIVWHRLDVRLNDPIRVEHTPRRTRLWVLDIAYYEVDRDLRLVRGGLVQRTGELRLSRTVDLGNPLADESWFMSLSGRIFDGWPESERFYVPLPNGNTKARGSAMKRLWERLSSDRRFHTAIQTAVPHELGLDMEIWRLASDASIWWQGLTADEYQLVWQNLPTFRQVEAENPGLLKIIPIFLFCHDDRFRSDPIMEIKEWFCARGLSEAGWRHFVRGGMDHYVPLLRRMHREARLLGLLRFLKLVKEMEFDINLFDVVTEAWIDSISERECFLSLAEDWRQVHPSVLRVAYHASSDIGAWCAEERAKELPLVLRWAKEDGVVLNRQQVRAGWSALAKRWRQARPEEAEGVVPFRFEWMPPAGRLEFGPLAAIPLSSAAELRGESEAMRNCLGGPHFTEACRARRMAVYSIRRIDTGERVAVASYVRRGTKRWTLQEVKGPSNSRAAGEVIKVAKDISGVLQATIA